MWALWAWAGLAAGGLAGFALGWWAAGRRQTPGGGAALEAELRTRLEAAEAALGQARERETQRERDLARAEAERQAQAALLAQERGLHERQLAEAREARDKALADMREAFKALSAEALGQNMPEFIRQAGEAFARFQETAKGDLSNRQEAIAGLLKPLEAQLKIYQERLQQAGTAQAETLGAVRKQLETLTAQSQTLASETERFRMVLRSNQARGRWGEETLRRVVEAAGMSAHCDFIEQVAEEDRKPDMIVRLPGDRLIVVDAKVPDLDFLGALDTADAAKRGTLLEQHARKLKDTIRDLARRDYPAQFPHALDHVVLFLPAESLFSAALEGDRDLIVWAADQRILLATPASLIALLRAVAVSWQQDAQRQNAEQIVEAATELYDRVAVLVSHFGGIGQHLRRASEAFNRAVGSYDTRVRPSGERLRAMGVRSADEKRLDAVETVDATLRLPAASAGGGTGRTMTATVTDTRTTQGTGLGHPCQVVLYNDDRHTMEFVVECLMRVFGHTADLAAKIMWEAHRRGRAIAEVEDGDAAGRHCAQLTGYGLRAEVEGM